MASQLVLHQSDHETPAVGPLLNPDGTYYAPGVGHSTTLTIKANQWATDTSGKTYTGSFIEDATDPGQWWAVFTVPSADLQTLGKFFYRCKVVDNLGQPQTVVGGDLIVDPGRKAQRASTTTAPVLIVAPFDLDGGAPDTVYDGLVTIDGGTP